MRCVILFFLLSAVVSSAYANEPSDDVTKPMRVAAFLPLTGGAGEQGEWCRKGFEMAIQDMVKDGGRGITVHYEDTIGNPSSAVQAYKRLKNSAPITAIVTWGSGVGIALSPLVNADKVIQIGIATSSAEYSSKGDYTFRIYPSSQLEAEYLGHFIESDLGNAFFSLIYVENDYGAGLARALRSHYSSQPEKIRSEDVFRPGEVDFRAQLSRLKSKEPSLIVLASYPTEAALLIKQARQLGLGGRFLASAGIGGNQDNFFKLAGEAAEGTLLCLPAVPKNHPFQEKYEVKYGLTPKQTLSASSYDALMLLNRISRICGNQDAECMRDRLFEVKDYAGAYGTLSFDKAGDIKVPFHVLEARNQTFVSYQGSKPGTE